MPQIELRNSQRCPRAADLVAGLLPREPRLLRLFDALFATGSVTKAAEKLGQSQPTISIWLARLRKELDDPLFIRSAEGMLPTPRAEALIGTARQDVGDAAASGGASP